jgi:exosortase O
MPTAREKSWMVANAALGSAWVFLHAPVIGWLGARFVGSPLHAGIVVGAAALLLRGLRGIRPRDALSALARPPRRAPVPVALVAGAAVAVAFCERRFGPTTLSAVLAGLGAYGLSGLYLDAARFRRALPAALLLTFLLPFGEQADTYFGFAARAFSARTAAGLLQAIGKPTATVETLLLLENGVAHVDVPCSGARSLWTGLIFFLAATCLLGRRPGARWLLAGLVHLALLVAENVVRVAAVVLLAVALDLPHVAEILHAPIGVLGFTLACALTLFVLRRFVPAPAALAAVAPAPPAPPAFAPAMAVALFALALARGPRAAIAGAPPFHLDLGPSIAADPLPLSVAEGDLFRRWGGAADKRRFRAGAVRGSVLAVFSRTFRAHHAPEVCLAGSGVRVEGLRAVSVGGDDTVRVADADGGRRTAIYWFQSPGRTTGDLAARVWEDVSGREHRWVQVSIIVDAPLDVASAEGRALVADLRAAVARALTVESP